MHLFSLLLRENCLISLPKKLSLNCHPFLYLLLPPVAYRPVTSSSAIPSVYVSLSGKSPSSFSRNSHIAQASCRTVRSPIDFRQGRRASDGLVGQGILNRMEDDTNSVAFSQRLDEACKAKGVLELNRIQKEAASLSSQYQSCLPQEEINVRQREHLKYVVTPSLKSSHSNNEPSLDIIYQPCRTIEEFYNFNKNVEGIASDISSYLGLVNNEISKYDSMGDSSSMNNIGGKSSALQQAQKPPLQQQLMQHRLLQQKRQILQKQGAMETGLSRRHSQMLRQQSYKAAQNQQVLPPLPLTEKESEDLIAFQSIVENPEPLSSSSSPNFALINAACGGGGAMKSSHLHSLNSTPYISPSVSPQTVIFGSSSSSQGDESICGVRNLLPKNLHNAFQSCQISDQSSAPSSLYHQVGMKQKTFFVSFTLTLPCCTIMYILCVKELFLMNFSSFFLIFFHFHAQYRVPTPRRHCMRLGILSRRSRLPSSKSNSWKSQFELI